MEMGWSVADLAKPQVIIESTFGDSPPPEVRIYSRLLKKRKKV